MEACNLLIVSDLHLCEGFDPESGTFFRQEDFLFDGAFARFLRYHEEVKGQPRFGGRPWLLVFNGDLFEFMQVISKPEEGEPLLRVKGVELYEQLDPDEQRYGLGTTAAESEWKLEQIARGHQRFFAGLGWFVACGNHVVVVKGNHDIELHWPNVQERFVAEIERAYAQQRQMLGEGPPVTPEEIEERVHFYPWFYHEPGRVYVEHGGQYESSSYSPDFLNPVYPDDPERVQLPWGSLFLRYLFNELEDVHPFADNVKPPTRYFLWAFRRDPIMTVRLLVTRGWIFLRAFWRVGRAALQRLQKRDQPEWPELALPPEVVHRIAALAKEKAGGSQQEWVGMAVMGVLALPVLVLLVLAVINFISGLWLATGAYLLGAVLFYLVRRWAGGRVPTFDDLMPRVAGELEQKLGPDHAVRYIVLGHDHLAALKRLERAWYVNTGAWVLIFEKKGPIEGRERLTFFRLPWGYEGTPDLLRWDDAAGEPARLMLELGD